MPGWGALMLVAVLASGLAAALTGLIRNAALRAAVLDQPNPRSLHTEPVPRGGGGAIVLTVAAAVVVGWWLRGTPGEFAAAAGAPLTLLAATGWLDDRFDLPRRGRLALQCGAAVMFIAIAGFPTGFEFGPLTLRPGGVGAVLAVLWIVWVTNLYNFMDGIDGLAAMQGIVAAATAGFWFHAADDPAVTALCFVTAGACFGFLYYNWAPARIFLGDVGSLSLGGLFALLGVYGVVRHDMPFGAFVLLLGVFAADATATLLRRMIRGEKWLEPHRSHYYQRLVLTELSHATVTAALSALFVLCAVLASLEAQRVAPRALWYGLAALAVIAGAIGVNLRERVRR